MTLPTLLLAAVPFVGIGAILLGLRAFDARNPLQRRPRVLANFPFGWTPEMTFTSSADAAANDAGPNGKRKAL